MPLSSSVQHPYGITPSAPVRGLCTMRGGAGNKGQIVRLDIGGTDTASTGTGNSFGQKTDAVANVLLATNTHDEGHIHGVLEADAADDAEVWVTFRGVVQALGGGTIDVSSNTTGNQCTVVAGSELNTAITNSKILALPLEDVADATLSWFLFDGINGFSFKGS